MIGESTQALILIRAAIWSLRLITPLSFLYWILFTIATILPQLKSTWPLLDSALLDWRTTNLVVWGLRLFSGNEVWFYFWSQNKIREYQHQSEYDLGLDSTSREKIFKQVVTGLEDPGKFLSGWFLGAAPEEIQRDNLSEWMLWAFFNKGTRDAYISDHDNEITQELNRYIEFWQQTTQLVPEPGYNRDIKCIRLNSDPVKVIHRPACVYIAVGVLYDFLGWSRYYTLGLRHYLPSTSSGHRIVYPTIGLPSYDSKSVLTYWYKPCPALAAGEKEDLPVVFIHGIGAGLKIYRDMITKFSAENPRSAIYLLEMPAVTMKFMDKLPRKKEYVEAVGALLRSNGHSHALFCGHSLGTVVATWLIHLDPGLCKRVILVDPVCFLLHLPSVAYNFLHRTPQTANHWLYWYFVSNEPGIAWFLGRGFFWTENILWLSEIPSHCELTVYLSENDMIVDVPSVFKYLTNETIPFNTSNKLSMGDKIVRPNKDHTNVQTVLWSGPGMDHAMFLLLSGPSADIVESVHSAVVGARSEAKV